MNNLEDTGTIQTPPQTHVKLDGNLMDKTGATLNELSNGKVDSSVRDTNQLIDRDKLPILKHAGSTIDTRRSAKSAQSMISNDEPGEHKLTNSKEPAPTARGLLDE